MTKNDIISTIKETAAKHGFTAEESSWYRWPNITEQGTHSQLMRARAGYYELYTRQYEDMAADAVTKRVR